MGRNHEVTERHLLLDENGELVEPGWSRSLLQVYDRKMIKAPKWRSGKNRSTGLFIFRGTKSM